MADIENDSPREPDRVLRWTMILFAVVLLILGAFATFRMMLRHTLDLRLQQTHQAGYWVALDELDEAYVQPPPGQNAADVYQKAFSAFVEPADVAKQIPAFSADVEYPEACEPLPPEMLQAMQALVDDNSRTLELLREAAAMEQCRYPIEIRQGYDTLLPHLGSLRRAGRLLAVEARLHIERGEVDAALECIRTAYAAGESLENEPFLVSQLVRTSIEVQAIGEVEWVLSRAQFDGAQLSRLEKILSRGITAEQMQKALTAEGGVGMSVFRMPVERAQGMYNMPPTVVRLQRASGLSDLDQLAYLDILKEMHALATQPPQERRFADNALDEKVRSLPRYCLATRTMVPALGAAFNAIDTLTTHRRLAQAGIAVERYRLANGTLPSTLEELVPAYLDDVPIDPFTDKPIQYRHLDTGYLLYGVGKDGTDNGGKAGGAGQPDPDVLFSVER
jgi:hypothetical protein